MAFLAPVLGPVVNLIGSQLLAEYARINGITNKIETWDRKLRMIQAVLDSAEEKQMNGDAAADQWLSDLREVAYDMEDLLEHFSVDAKGNAYEVQALSRSSKLCNCLIACCSRLYPRTLISNHRMANEIDEVDRRLEEVFSHITILGSPLLNRQLPHQSTSLPEHLFVGREKQMEELITRLSRSGTTDDSVRPFTVVSIVGMGGLGKTTLARQIYYHYSNVAEFDVKAWSTVSDISDRVAIMKSILEQVAPGSSGMKNDPNMLHNSLKGVLSNKKFLIVLDDVWKDKYQELTSLFKPFYSGSKGSIILLTTRNLEVSKLVGDPDPMQLELLPIEDCVSLLAHHSIDQENFERYPHLQDTSVQISKRCKGLPLAIKTIGGLLRFEDNVEKWKQMLDHDIWEIENRHGQGNVALTLKLSYIHLPIHLKRCFVACAIFPKDYLFDRDELIKLWITHGLLQKRIDETYQKVGMENLCKLEDLSLIQRVKDKKTHYLMHDFINDLAKSVEIHTYFSSDKYKEGSSCEKSLDKVRHATVVIESLEKCTSKRFDVYRKMKKLRTFMPFQVSLDPHQHVQVSEEVVHDLIMNMKNLRMLSMRCFKLFDVPKPIGELKLLRSIDFSHTEIKVLPESICDLVELKSLLLRGCLQLEKLPMNIHKLTKLLHLDIAGASNLKEMPPYISDLTNLEILTNFIVGKEDSRKLKQLGPLNRLQQELHIHNLFDVDDINDARMVNLHQKEALVELSFDWGSSFPSSGEEDNQLEVLDQLQPSRTIESLAIYGYGGKRFPSWFGNSHMYNVKSITLVGCRSVDLLPPFGQLPALERLAISGLGAISSIGAEFYGTTRPFQSLRSLSFEDMGAWEKWSSHDDSDNDQPFPCLHELKVVDCPKLDGGITFILPSLVKIHIYGCNKGLLNIGNSIRSL